MKTRKQADPTTDVINALLDSAETLMASRKSPRSPRSTDSRAAALARAERDVAQQPKVTRGERIRAAERDVDLAAPKDPRLLFSEMSLRRNVGRR